jgi:hypothetical protein
MGIPSIMLYAITRTSDYATDLDGKMRDVINYAAYLDLADRNSSIAITRIGWSPRRQHD